MWAQNEQGDLRYIIAKMIDHVSLPEFSYSDPLYWYKHIKYHKPCCTCAPGVTRVLQSLCVFPVATGEDDDDDKPLIL